MVKYMVYTIVLLLVMIEFVILLQCLFQQLHNTLIQKYTIILLQAETCRRLAI